MSDIFIDYLKSLGAKLKPALKPTIKNWDTLMRMIVDKELTDTLVNKVIKFVNEYPIDFNFNPTEQEDDTISSGDGEFLTPLTTIISCTEHLDHVITLTKLFVSKGADVNMKDGYGDTPGTVIDKNYDLCRSKFCDYNRYPERYYALVKFLLDSGMTV